MDEKKETKLAATAGIVIVIALFINSLMQNGFYWG